jgi:phenylalanine-4-hydroxylase
MEAECVQRHPLQLEWVVKQSFEIDRYQPLLFIVDSFEHLYDLLGELDRWVVAGRLANVAAGEPIVQGKDLLSFQPIPVN